MGLNVDNAREAIEELTPKGTVIEILPTARFSSILGAITVSCTQKCERRSAELIDHKWTDA